MPGPMICNDRSTANDQEPPRISRPTLPALLPVPRIPASLLLIGLLTSLSGVVSPALARDQVDQSPAIIAPVPSVAGTANAGTANPGAGNATPATETASSAVEVVVRPGDSLSKILRAQAIPNDNRQAVLAAIGDIFDPASLQVGAHLRFTFAPTSPDGVGAVPLLPSSRLIQTVELISDGATAFTVHVDAETPLPAQAANLPAKPASSAQPSTTVPSAGASSASDKQSATASPSIWIAAAGQQSDDADQFVVRHAAGIVGKNFRNTLQAVHLPAPLIDEVLIGFKATPSQQAAKRETVPQNAAFEVIYEGVLHAGKFAAPQLRYAMINDGRTTRRIYRYQTDDATTALMQDDGHGVALIDLGRPLQINARITSPFGWRIHPVFGDRRFHEGVDFGAPTGTPVIATSDGVIEDIGWRGNYGDYIRLRRDGHLATAYAHLSGFARGLTRGSTVKRGDVIAYVGRTGVATGPHLYYEVLVDGKQIDPMKTPPAVPVSLKGAQLAEFQKFVETAPEE